MFMKINYFSKMYCVFAAVCVCVWGGGGGTESMDILCASEEENTCSVLSKLIQNIYFRCFKAAHT